MRKPRSKALPYIIMLNDNACFYPTPDKLVDSLDYPFTKAEKDFINTHRGMDRTKLHKLLSSSASKLQMNMYMDKMYGKPKQKRR